MEYFEVSPLASFNIRESLTELSRLVLTRNGMERLWRNNKGNDVILTGTLPILILAFLLLVLSLQEACCRCVVKHLGGTVHDVDRLPIPVPLQLQIRSYADSAQLTATNTIYNTSTIRRRTTGGGFLLQHKRSGSDVSGGRRTANGANGCGGPGSYLTIPNGNFNIQGRLSNGYHHHQRSLSAVMTPLWNKLHRNHNSGVSSGSSSSRRATMPASTATAPANHTVSAPLAEHREEEENAQGRENGRRSAGRENCCLM